MKILSPEQLKQADEFTIHSESITELELMERAAAKCVEWLINKFPLDYNFSVLCGTGNNGGDGFAIARLLLEKKYNVSVFFVKHSDKFSDSAKKNYDLLKNIREITLIEEEQKAFLINPIDDKTIF